MKINKIHIHNYYQFQDLALDLTYPLGHEKAGMPLDKVCLIGQSGTGKTSLLQIIEALILRPNQPYQTKISAATFPKLSLGRAARI